jgi:hypothetical protein
MILNKEDKERTFNIIVEHEVSEQEMEDLLDTAFGNSGIWYWAGAVKVKGEYYDGSYVKALLENRTLSVYDTEEEEWHDLTLDAFIKAISVMMGKNQFKFSNYDGVKADNIVQYAIFGHVEYS